MPPSKSTPVSHAPYASYSLLALSMLLNGANIGFGKAAVAIMPVVLFGLLRYVIAVIAMAPQYFKAAPRLNRSEWFNLCGQTFFGTFLFTLCMLYGVQHTTATAAGVITSTLPAAVAILSRVILKEQLSARTIFSIVLAILGVTILTFTQNDTKAASLIGNLFVIGAVICEAIYIIFSKRLTGSLSPIPITAYSHLLGLFLMLPFGLSAALSYDFSSISISMWGVIIWYALAASVFSFWLWLSGSKHVPANIAGIFTACMPIAAAFVGVVFLGEQLSWAHIVALVLVLTGIAIASWPQSRPVKFTARSVK